MSKEPRIKKNIVGNGWSIPVFECDWCGGDMGEWVDIDDESICPKCALLNGIITESEFIKMYIPDYFRDGARVKVVGNEILIALKGEKFPSEKANKDYRHSNEYKEWRNRVFERDGFKCQECGQVGSSLNAHHIKTFKDYPKLRFDVSNGITLCEKCHRELHKRIRYAGKEDVHKKDYRK